LPKLCSEGKLAVCLPQGRSRHHQSTRVAKV
jgi:hypothetical protein